MYPVYKIYQKNIIRDATAKEAIELIATDNQFWVDYDPSIVDQLVMTTLMNPDTSKQTIDQICQVFLTKWDHKADRYFYNEVDPDAICFDGKLYRIVIEHSDLCPLCLVVQTAEGKILCRWDLYENCVVFSSES